MEEKSLEKTSLPEPDIDLGEELEEEILYEPETTWGEVIQSVFAAFSCIDDIDMEMASPMDRKRIKRIRRKGLRMIDVGIGEIYAEKFETDDNNEED